MDAHARLERLVADALTSADPVAGFERAARDPELPSELRDALACAQPAGIRMAALIVARLRFERLMQGSSPAAEWFARDPADFARAFKLYHHAVPATGALPADEARLFERWRAG